MLKVYSKHTIMLMVRLPQADISLPISSAEDVFSLQALLDMYTIQRELGHLENIRIGLVGDLANGRTARSLAFLLSMYKGIKMYFVAPDVVRMKDDIKSFFRSRVRSTQNLFRPHGTATWTLCAFSVALPFQAGHPQMMLLGRLKLPQYTRPCMHGGGNGKISQLSTSPAH